MKSSNIVMNFIKNPDKGIMNIYWGNDLYVLSNEDYGIYDFERYAKSMDGNLKKISGGPKAANIMYNSQGNVVSIIFFTDQRLIEPTSIINIKYNENNTVSEEIILDGRSLALIMKYTYEYDQLGRIIRRVEYRDYKNDPVFITTYSYVDDSDDVRYMEEYLYSDPTWFADRLWFTCDGHMLYRITTDRSEGHIYCSKYKYNKKKDNYKCKTTMIDF